MKKSKENPGQLILGAHYQNSAAVDDHDENLLVMGGDLVYGDWRTMTRTFSSW